MILSLSTISMLLDLCISGHTMVRSTTRSLSATQLLTRSSTRSGMELNSQKIPFMATLSTLLATSPMVRQMITSSSNSTSHQFPQNFQTTISSPNNSSLSTTLLSEMFSKTTIHGSNTLSESSQVRSKLKMVPLSRS